MTELVTELADTVRTLRGRREALEGEIREVDADIAALERVMERRLIGSPVVAPDATGGEPRKTIDKVHENTVRTGENPILHGQEIVERPLDKAAKGRMTDPSPAVKEKWRQGVAEKSGTAPGAPAVTCFCGASVHLTARGVMPPHFKEDASCCEGGGQPAGFEPGPNGVGGRARPVRGRI